MSGLLRIGTRGSALAVAQSEQVAERIRQLDPSLTVELVRIRTSGDRVSDRPLAEIGGKGLFVKEIEEALLAGAVDVGVHSMKDLPGSLPDGLAIVAVPAREDPRDVLVWRGKGGVDALPPGARVGTASLRRRRCCAPGGRTSTCGRCAATSTRGSASGAPARSTRSCSRRPGSRGSASRSRKPSRSTSIGSCRRSGRVRSRSRRGRTGRPRRSSRASTIR